MSAEFRPTWDDYFMAIARIVATRGTCDRLRVGAVLVKNNRIISTGYNGAPPGLPHCDGPEGHLMEEGHCIRSVHGEENTILQAAAIGGTSPQGGTLYTTYSPCYHCAKKIIVAGITRVVACVQTKNTLPIDDVFKYANIKLDYYTPNPEWHNKLETTFATPLAAPPSKETTIIPPIIATQLPL